jgi:monoamine oxidase
MYFNPGPARLPYHHEGILAYCRELGVALEVMSNDNRGALLQSDTGFDGKPQRNRQVVDDIRGTIAELAAKALDRDALSQPVGADDKDRIRAMLRAFGALDADMAYNGSPRAGYSVPPGGGTQSGTLSQPLDLRRILDAGFWRFQTNFGEGWHQAATMMQPVGGMGRIGQAFGRSLRGIIRYGAEVRELRRSGDGARIVWRNAKTGREQAIEAPFVVVTIPLPVLGTIPVDFSADVRAVLSPAAEGRRPVPVCRRAHVVHQRLAGRRGEVGACHARRYRDADGWVIPTLGMRDSRLFHPSWPGHARPDKRCPDE